MQGHVPSLAGSDCKTDDQTELAHHLELFLRIGLMVENKAFTHVSVFMPLVLSRDENGKNAGAELARDVFHKFSVWTSGVNTAFTLEVGSYKTVIITFATEPRFVNVTFCFFQPFEHLREKSVSVTLVHFSIKCILRSLKAVEIDFDSTLIAL